MHEEETYYTIEYLVGLNGSSNEDWEYLSDSSLKLYRFDDAAEALAKAGEIARQGKWGQPIKLRVMKYNKMVNSWKLREFEPKDYYTK